MCVCVCVCVCVCLCVYICVCVSWARARVRGCLVVIIISPLISSSLHSHATFLLEWYDEIELSNLLLPWKSDTIKSLPLLLTSLCHLDGEIKRLRELAISWARPRVRGCLVGLQARVQGLGCGAWGLEFGVWGYGA